MKICNVCGIEKDDKDFRKVIDRYKDKTCRKCRTKEHRIWQSKKRPLNRPAPTLDRHSYCMYGWLNDKPGSLHKEVI